MAEDDRNATDNTPDLIKMSATAAATMIANGGDAAANGDGAHNGDGGEATAKKLAPRLTEAENRESGAEL